jgi:hypothetical protein
VGFIPDVMLLRVQRAWAPMNGGCRRWRWRQTLQETSKIGSGDPQFPGAGRAGTVAAALADGGSRVLVDQCRSRHNHKQIREIACLFLLNGKNQSQHAHPAMWGGGGSSAVSTSATLDADHRRASAGDSLRATSSQSTVEADGVGRGDGISEEKQGRRKRISGSARKGKGQAAKTSRGEERTRGVPRRRGERR